MWFAPTWPCFFLRLRRLILFSLAAVAAASASTPRVNGAPAPGGRTSARLAYVQTGAQLPQKLKQIQSYLSRSSKIKTLESAQKSVAYFLELVQIDQATFWDRFKWSIAIAVALLLQTLLIAILLLERAKRWRASLQLAESEERYRNVVEVQTELICRFLTDTTLTFVNDAYCRYFQKTRSELIGSKFIDLIPPAARAPVLAEIHSLLANPRPEVHEHEVVRPDGSSGWQQWSNHLISRGKVIEFQGIGRDITGRKLAEEALIHSEEFNRKIVESSSDCVKVLDLDGNLIYMSERGQKLLEITDIDPFIDTSWINLWQGIDRINARKAVAAAARGEVGSFQGQAQTMSGSPRSWHTVITPMRGSQGNIERLLAVSRDITDQELALRAIQESEERFVKAFKANPQPMSLTTFDEGMYVDVNESFLEMSGYCRDEVLGRTSTELNIFESPEHRRKVLIDPLLNGGTSNPFEMNFRTKPGNFKVLLSSAELLELGGKKCILVASTDISERKILEENLRLSEREFSTLVQNSPDVICRLDSQIRFIYVSPAFERLSGLPSESVVGLSPKELEFEDYDWRGLELACSQAIELKKQMYRATEYNKRHYSTRVIPEFSPDGTVESVMTISEDVTDRIHSEQELLKLTVRLFNLQDEERRRIARELHDGTAQNLFAISVNLAKLGQLSSSNTDEAHQLIDECLSLGDQSLQEIRTLSYLLHPPLLDQAGLVSALHWYVEGFTKRSGIYVDVFAEPVGRLPADVEMALFRVVQEALTNVRRHSASETANIRLEQRSDNIVLEIKDNGRGLTTGRDNQEVEALATGVGIPSMKQRLRQLGGRLEIISTERGTTISAVVPIGNGESHGSNIAS